MIASARARHFGLLVFLLAELFLVQSGLAGVLTVAAAAAAAVGVTLAAVAVLALVAGLAAPSVPPTRIRTAIRDRERRTAFLSQRDPDAAGRPRPRAPGRLVPTAA
ncbi:DUF6412 domain-containing protein [Streptomyces sp. GC420]|uniref:DUF6412 domain-containing protein n=1 Tax=Streptomyces sp. GC420 TaxID=2697568 RepID=UPI001414E594|nr:DUF6412 domain-containing protein [Streptomyces sp. GC420]NBM16784.1 hypothetical protein [Streptomyces sp. GC420]